MSKMANLCEDQNCKSIDTDKQALTYCEECHNFLCERCCDASHHSRSIAKLCTRERLEFKVPICRACWFPQYGSKTLPTVKELMKHSTVSRRQELFKHAREHHNKAYLDSWLLMPMAATTSDNNSAIETK